MDSNRKTAIVVGALFLTAMVTYLLGASLIQSILDAPDLIAQVSANGTLVTLGVLLELVNCVAIVGIAVMMFPLFKEHSEPLALGTLLSGLLRPQSLLLP